jgi:hypothetical protein
MCQRPERQGFASQLNTGIMSLICGQGAWCTCVELSVLVICLAGLKIDLLKEAEVGSPLRLLEAACLERIPMVTSSSATVSCSCFGDH